MEVFQRELKIFDCNAALGRRHKERIIHDSKDVLLRVLSEVSIAPRALVYNPYCISFGTLEGNLLLLQEIGEKTKNLIPQFVVSFATDEIDEFQVHTRKEGVRTLRIVPLSHGFPLVHWIADTLFEWMASERMALWVPLGRYPEVDIRDLYTMASRHRRVPIVLAGSSYSNYSTIWPLLKALDHLYFDLSRFDITNGIERLIRLIGVRRLLFGSGFPDVDPKPYLYYLFRCGLQFSQLQQICNDNLEVLLFEGH